MQAGEVFPLLLRRRARLSHWRPFQFFLQKLCATLDYVNVVLAEELERGDTEPGADRCLHRHIDAGVHAEISGKVDRRLNARPGERRSGFVVIEHQPSSKELSGTDFEMINQLGVACPGVYLLFHLRPIRAL